MEKHECYIGLWNDDYTRLITFEEIIQEVKSHNRTYEYAKKEYGIDLGQPFKLSDYFDRRKSTNLNHFNYCPYCGEKIDWKILKIGAAAK